MERRHGWSMRGQWDTARFPYGVHGAHGGSVPPDVGWRLLADWTPGSQAGTLSLDQLMEMARALGVPCDLEGSRDQAMYTELREEVRKVLRARVLRGGSQVHLGHAHHPAHTHHRPAVHPSHPPVEHRSSGGVQDATPKHEEPPPPAPGPVAEVVHCRITEFSVMDKKRTPSSKRVLQVVPEAELKEKHGYSREAGYPKEMSEKLDKWESVIAAAEKAGSWGDYLKSQRGKKGPGHVDPAKETYKASYAHYGNGQAKVQVKAAYAPDCGTKHPLVATGPHGMTKPGNEAVFPFGAPTAGGRMMNARPDVYQLKGHGCEGRTDTVRVEVFPSDEYVVSLGIEEKCEVFKHVMEKVGEVLKFAGMGEAEVSAEGGLDASVGWRADKEGWRAYYAMELAAKAGVSFGIKFNVSFVSLATGVPSGLLKYVGDIGMNVGVTLSGEFKGGVIVRKFPGSEGDGKDLNVTGELKVEGSGSVPIELYAFIGPHGILSAAASGKVEPKVTLEAEPKIDEGTVNLETKGKLEQGEVTVSLLFTALFWESRKDWHVHLWDERTLFERTYPLFDVDRDRHAGAA